MKEAPLYAFKTLADLTATSVKDQCRTRDVLELLHHELPRK